MANNSQMTHSTYIFIDIITYLLTFLPGIVSWSLMISFIHYIPFPIFVKILLSPFVLVFGFVTLIACIRLLLPKLEPGYHRIGINKMTLTWFMHLALSRAARVSCLENMLLSSFVFKFLYWRALGAKIPFQLNSSLGVEMVDASLISIGKNSVIGDKTDISCHMFRGNLLYLAPNVIGDNVQISAACMLGPGNTIGDNCKLGYGSKLLNRELAPYTKINDHEAD